MNAAQITLAAVLALAADFHDGMRLLSEEKYDPAVKAFTKVIDAELSVSDIRILSYFHRAKAHQAKERKKEALNDLATVMRAEAGATLTGEAMTLYKELGGDLKDLRPKESPRQVATTILAALAKGDQKATKACLSGSLLQLLNTVDTIFRPMEGEGFLAEMGRELSRLNVIKESFNDEARTASVTATIENMTLTFGLQQEGGKWMFTSLLNFAPEHDRRAARARPEQANMIRLSQIGKGLIMYSMDNDERFPAELEDMGEYLDNAAVFRWVHPRTGQAMEFLYHAGLTAGQDASIMIAAAPVAVDNRREVLRIDGSVTFVNEADFVRMAETQGWKIPALVKKDDVAEDIRKEVVDLIAELGAPDAKVRNAARKRLKAIGVDAFPFLEDHRDHSDPEIRMAVKELLGR